MTVRTWGFDDYRLWRRIYDKRVLTDDYTYAEGEVPEEYAGPELEIEFNQIMVFATPAGQFFEYRVMDVDTVRDKDNNTGVGYEYTLYENEPSLKTDIKVEAVAPATAVVEWYSEDTKNFSTQEMSQISAMYKNYQIESGEIEFS